MAAATGRGELPAHQRHRRCGQHDRDKCHRRERQCIPLELPRRGVERRIEQHRRDEEREREIRLDLNRRRERQDRQSDARQRQQRGIRDLEPARERGYEHGAEQKRERPFEQNHAYVIAAASTVVSLPFQPAAL